MKCVLLSLLIFGTTLHIHADAYRIAITNNQPCAFIDSLVISDFGDSASSAVSVDLIRYIRASNASKAIYLYRGPALYDLWSSDPALMPAGVRLGDQVRRPDSSEIGRIGIGSARISFDAIESKRLKKIFSKADDFLKLYRSEGSMTNTVHRAYDKWIQDRFKDIEPDPLVKCVDMCSCQPGRYVFYQ